MLTLTPGVDFDFDFVNARIRDGTTSFTDVGLLMAMMAAHLSGFASIPLSVSMKPKNFPASTPKTHFSRFSLRRVNLDLLDEAREEARIKAEAVKRRVERQYSSKVKPRQFQIGDLVMRKAHPYELENKLSPKWTGPFRVTEAKGNGSYNLETLEGGPIPRSWNAANLKFYFS